MTLDENLNLNTFLPLVEKIQQIPCGDDDMVFEEN